MRKKDNARKLGTFCEFMSPSVAECLCFAGADFVVIDAEHSPADDETILHMIRAADACGGETYVRAKDGCRSTVLRLADMGPAGIIVPDIRSVKEVEDLVLFGKYFPQGRRGLGFARSARFGRHAGLRGGMGQYFDETNRALKIIPQCETVEAVECIDDICQVGGVDGIFVGPFDLSVALGVPGEVDHAAVAAAVAHILDACKRHDKIALVFASDRGRAAAYLNDGFDSVVVGTDASFLLSGMSSCLEGILQ
jgi:4-hydroxy-2-oxoheptanedioate aldolase